MNFRTHLQNRESKLSAGQAEITRAIVVVRAISATLILGLGPLYPVRTAAEEVLPKLEPPFKGKIGRTADESKPDYPKGIEAPKGAPNVLLILTGDVGFGASSAFGGPIPTPNFDKLGLIGLRYNRFHTTGLGPPTRAALITGRNHHTCATGVPVEFGTGYPGYNSLMSRSCGTIAQVLKGNGYNTAWFGKSEIPPDWQSSQAGPFDLWPTGLGFECFYGFIGAGTDQWRPALFDGTRPIEPPNDPKYHLDADLADHAITWIRQQHSLAPEKPFFLYYAPGLCHAPHHAPKEWIAKFKGYFDKGWDAVREETLARQIEQGVVPANTKLTDRPKEIPAWDSLSANQKRVYARMMEVYAGCLSFCDFNIGRVIQAIEDTGELDNTLMIYIMGDNGASAEGTLQGSSNEVAVAANGLEENIDYLASIIDQLGGPLTYNHYPVGWAYALNSPFKWSKGIASHFGGTRNGMAIAWPARIKQIREIRSQFTHVIDIVPTIYEAIGLKEPTTIDGVKQKPIEGASIVYTFNDGKAKERHTSQYFESFGNRAIYTNDWIASTTPPLVPWKRPDPGSTETNPDDFQWELYNLAEDFSQANDLAAQNSTKLKELQGIFDREAKKYNVYPLDARFAGRDDRSRRPSLTRGRNQFTYYPGTIRVPETAAPDLKNKSYTITAEVDIPDGGADGCIATQGGRFGGWGLLIIDGKPQFVHAFSNRPEHKYRVVSDQKLGTGKHIIKFEFAYEGSGLGKGGIGTITVDNTQVAEGRIERTIPTRISGDETFDTGQDSGTPVVEDYAEKMPFKFRGGLGKITIELGKNDGKLER